MHILVLDSIFASTETNLDISINHAYPRIEKSLQNTIQEYDSRTYRIISFIVQYCVIGSRLTNVRTALLLLLRCPLGSIRQIVPYPTTLPLEQAQQHLLVICSLYKEHVNEPGATHPTEASYKLVTSGAVGQVSLQNASRGRPRLYLSKPPSCNTEQCLKMRHPYLRSKTPTYPPPSPPQTHTQRQPSGIHQFSLIGAREIQ